jgi:hypothetical protein
MILHYLSYLGAASILALVLVRHRRLSNIPGPFFASWTDLWRFYIVQTGQFQRKSISLHARYGHLVRVGPNTISISDPAAIPIVHSMHGEFQKV